MTVHLKTQEAEERVITISFNISWKATFVKFRQK